MPQPSKPNARPPADYVSRLLDDWGKERPDLAVEPVAIVHRLRRLAALLTPQVDQVFAGSGISNPDFAVLANLRRSGAPYQLSQRQLMNDLALTSGTVSVRLDRLAKAGLVRREPDPRDQRGALVTLTSEGERVFDTLAPQHLANEARLVAALDDTQQAELADLLQTLLVEYEPPSEDRPDKLLGLTVAPAHVGLQRRAAVGLPATPGLLVEAVQSGGPAAVAGLQPGDLLLRSGRLVLRSLTTLAHALAAQPGRLRLDVCRGAQTTTVVVTVGD